MKKRIAVPIENGKLCSHFGGCKSFAFIDVEDNKVINTTIVNAPEHQTGSFPRFIISNKATDLIVRGIGPQAINILSSANINVHIGAPVEDIQKLVTDFINGKLELDNNYCDSEHHHHNHSHHHHN